MKYEPSVTPRSEREATIRKRLESANELGEPLYDFRGETFRPPVISLPIGMPVYRMENCRTFSAQKSTIAHNHFEDDFFIKGQELASAQRQQHAILVKLAKKGSSSVTPIYDVLEEDGQREAILITSTGVVVNGNRRLSAMRELYKSEDGSVDKRFANVKCAVCPQIQLRMKSTILKHFYRLDRRPSSITTGSVRHG